MITHGKQRTRIARRGNVLVKMIGIILLVMITTSGCPGAADWEYQLTDGYKIVRASSYDIILCDDNRHPGAGSSIVLPNYCVTDFCFNEQYIGVQGIPTAGYGASEMERESDQRWFYLVEVSTDTVYGPYDEDEYLAQCDSVAAGNMGKWCSTKEMDYYM